TLVHGEPEWIAATALSTILGHVYPIFHGFRGGKGVATTLGAIFPIEPLVGVTLVGIHIAARRISGRVSVGSLVAAIAAAPLLGTRLGVAHPATLAAILMTAIIFMQHRDNLARLAAGTEPRT